MISTLVKKIKKTFAGNRPEPDALGHFNQITNNNIHSKNVSLEAIAGHHIETRDNTHIDQYCTIGSYTYVGANTVITKATIGRYCSIGDNVTIGPGEHKLDSVSTSAFFYDSPLDVLTQKDCTIGNDVWIGVDSIIKRGVKIGNGAVVGANSVVTRDVPAYAIVAGSPAKILRYRFDDATIKSLFESEWWAYDLDEAKKIQQKFK